MSPSFRIKIQPARCCYRGWIHSNWAWRGVPELSWRSSNWKLESPGFLLDVAGFFCQHLGWFLGYIAWIVSDVWKFIAMFLSKPGVFFSSNESHPTMTKSCRKLKKNAFWTFQTKIYTTGFFSYLLIADGQHTIAGVLGRFSHHHFGALPSDELRSHKPVAPAHIRS